MRFSPALFLLAVLVPAIPPAHAVSSAEEGRLAEDLSTAMQSGETVWLEAEGARFLALFDETPWPNRRGGVLILHDQDGHPDRRPFPHALRMELPRRGWAVLALQLPNGESDDAAARLQAGLAWLEARKIAPLALIGHGAGGREAVQFLAGRKAAEPRALALLDVTEPAAPPALRLFLDALGQLRLPVTDIFCLRGTETPAAIARRAAASRLNIGYRQSALYDEPKRMEDMETMMVARLAGWLAKSLRAASPGPSAPPARR
ncbi:MAG TPA: DUF3530 family protein [Methylococcaceae bacterium]|nr:DUF3530 family protein [Methylococcaceae bacterium]